MAGAFIFGFQEDLNKREGRETDRRDRDRERIKSVVQILSS